jgi:hypothetical protein
MSVPKRLVPVAGVCLAVVLGSVGVKLLASGEAEPPEAPTAGHVAAEGGSATPTPRTTQARAPSRPASGPKGVPDRIAGPVLPESLPVSLRIPRLGVASPLVQLRLDSTGAMEVPQDPAVAGWYALGPSPGALGPAVIAGHVTWNGVPAVFSGLARLRTGDTVAVRREDGRTALFVVTRVVQVSKKAFPTQAVYGAVDHAALRLITCGGTYDQARHRYLDNVVVFARFVR